MTPETEGQASIIPSLRRAIAARRRSDPAVRAAMDTAVDIDAVFTTNALDGSTLTRAETVNLIKTGVAYGGIPFRDFAAAIGDAEALVEARRIADAGAPLTTDDATRLLDLLQQSIRPEIISAYGQASPECAAMTSPLSTADVARVSAWCAKAVSGCSGVLGAFDVHYEILVRSNAGKQAGRLARLVSNLLLMREGLLPIAIDPTRHAEYRRLMYDRHVSEQEGGSDWDEAVSAFHRFMLEMLVKTLEGSLSGLS